MYEGQDDSTVGMEFSLHVSKPGSIPDILYGTQSLPGLISENRARNIPWALLGVVPKLKWINNQVYEWIYQVYY